MNFTAIRPERQPLDLASFDLVGIPVALAAVLLTRSIQPIWMC
jgi:hypothetical protein